MSNDISLTKENNIVRLFERLFMSYYSINRKWRYEQTIKALAKYIVQVWEIRYREDSRMDEFTLTFYASRRRQRMMIPTDFNLSLFTHGFKQSEKGYIVNAMHRISYFKYQMHPANAYNQCITPEEEMKILYEIVGSIPDEYLKRYDFKVVDLPHYEADYEMTPEQHWMKSFVFNRKESKYD